MTSQNATYFNATNSTFNHINGNQIIHHASQYPSPSTLQETLQRRLDPVHIDNAMRSECLSKTRTRLIESIGVWIYERPERVLWLHGLAGSGKSTVCMSIVNFYQDQKRLGAAFFCDRLAVSQSQPSNIIRNIAYQLALFDPRIGNAILAATGPNAVVSFWSVYRQFDELLVKPLSNLPADEGAIVIVLDALDECGDAESRGILLDLLAAGSASLPPFVRILIASRKLADLSNAFTGQGHVLDLNINLESDNYRDVLRFIQYRLDKIRDANMKELPLSDWPTESDVQDLADLAAGLFIWASTACKFIDSHDPKGRLRTLVQRGFTRNAQAALDKLYQIALQTAGNWEDDDALRSDFSAIMGVILVARNPISPEMIDNLLALNERPSFRTIRRLGCVLHFTDSTRPVRILHPSFAEFLFHEDRCSPRALYIDTVRHHRFLAIRCVDHLDKKLKTNICNLTLSRAIHDANIAEATAYACTSWIDHICMAVDGVDFAPFLEPFLRRHLLHWLETMSILKKSRTTVTLVRSLREYLSPQLSIGSFLDDLLNDAYRFVQSFASSIEDHPLLVYHAALPFTPVGSVLFQTFAIDNPDIPRIVGGYNASWPKLLHMFCGHTMEVLDIKFSPDGKLIISSSCDNTIRIWNASSGELVLAPLIGHLAAVRSIAIRHDGKQIASGSADCTIRLWDSNSGIQLKLLLGHIARVHSVAFSPKGTRVVSGSEDRRTIVWCTSSGDPLILMDHSDIVTSVTYTPGGACIVSGSADGTVRMWHAESGTEMMRPLRGHNSSIMSLSVSSDGLWIASCGFNGTIRLWDATTGVEARTIRIRGIRANSMQFLPDGRRIACISDQEKLILVWDVKTGEEISASAIHQGGCCLAVSPSGDHFAVAFSDVSFEATGFIPVESHHTIGVWRIELNEHAYCQCRRSDSDVVSLQGHSSFICCIVFSADGRFIATGSRDRTVCVWNARTGSQTLVLRGHEDYVDCVAFSPDGSQIASGSSDRTVRLWNATTGGQLMLPLRGHKRYLVSVAFSPNAERVVSVCYGNIIYVWDAKSGEKYRRLRLERGVPILVEFHLNHEYLRVYHTRSCVESQRVDIWDIEQNHSLQRRPYTTTQLHRSPLAVDKDGWIGHSRSGRIISKLPTMVALKRKAGSKTSIAFTSNNKTSTMAIIHFPPNMHVSSEMPDDNTDSIGVVETHCAESDCLCELEEVFEVCSTDEDETTEEPNDERGHTGVRSHDSDGYISDGGLRIERIMPGQENAEICEVCEERC